MLEGVDAHNHRRELFAREAEADKHAGRRVSNERGLLRADASQQRHGMAMVLETDELLEISKHSDVRVAPPDAAYLSLGPVSLRKVDGVNESALRRHCAHEWPVGDV